MQVVAIIAIKQQIIELIDCIQNSSRPILIKIVKLTLFSPLIPTFGTKVEPFFSVIDSSKDFIKSIIETVKYS